MIMTMIMIKSLLRVLSFETCVRSKCFSIPTFSTRSNGDVFYLSLEISDVQVAVRRDKFL